MSPRRFSWGVCTWGNAGPAEQGDDTCFDRHSAARRSRWHWPLGPASLQRTQLRSRSRSAAAAAWDRSAISGHLRLTESPCTPRRGTYDDDDDNRFEKAALGRYSPGLGVCNSYEEGGNDTPFNDCDSPGPCGQQQRRRLLRLRAVHVRPDRGPHVSVRGRESMAARTCPTGSGPWAARLASSNC